MSKPLPAQYVALLSEIKERLRSAQYAALRSVKRELVALNRSVHRSRMTRLWVQAISRTRGAGFSDETWRMNETAALTVNIQENIEELGR